jgi:uncharacterized membrane protein
MSNNPYEAPRSELADEVPEVNVGTFSLEPRARDASAGLDWLSKAWTVFAQSPGPWIGIAFALFGIFLVVSIFGAFIPGSGLLQYLLMPVLIGGLMLGCHAQREGQEFSFNYLFKGFEKNTGQLFLVGAIYIGALIVLFVLVALVVLIVIGGGALLAGGLEQLSSGGLEKAMLSAGFLVVALIALLILAIALPFYMAVWFAPALVIINNLNAFDAMKLSFRACWRNFVPFLIYGLMAMMISIAATIPLALGWIVVGPLFIVSCYTSYRDIFYTD